MAAPSCRLLGNGVTDDALLHIARFLSDPRDLLRLQLTCSRFAAKYITASSKGRGGAAAAPEMLSIPEEAARRWVLSCSEQERGWVSFRTTERWLCLMHEVEVLRLPLAFGRHADFTLSENGALAARGGGAGIWRTAASEVVMRSGRHFAQFTMVEGDSNAFFGVIRPGWDVEGGTNAMLVDGHCFYCTVNGLRFPGRHDWEGRQTTRQNGNHIGMLLDLDQGSMAVYKNGVLMGVMLAAGLTGPLRWAVTLLKGDSARIDSALTPSSPTEEELAAAKESLWLEEGSIRNYLQSRKVTLSEFIRAFNAASQRELKSAGGAHPSNRVLAFVALALT